MKKLFILISLFISVPLFAQQRDSRVREYLPPARIVWQQESQLIQGADHLLLPGNGQSDLANRSICRLTSTDRQHPAILFDFGKELQGGLQIVTGMPTSHEPIAIRVRFGESASEAMCEIDGVNGATNDHAMRDFTICLPWLGVMEVGNSGFRFVRIDLLDDSAELHLKEVRAISTFRDIPYKGSFRCNDERLNKIWQTGSQRKDALNHMLIVCATYYGTLITVHAVLSVVSGVSSEMIAASFEQAIPTSTGNAIPGYLQTMMWFTGVLVPLGEIGYQLKRLFQFKKQQTLAKTFAQKRGLRNGGRSNSNIL